MVAEASVLLKMWYNDLDKDHRRTHNKYVGALTELLNVVGWPQLIEVLTCYWDNKKMAFQFGTVEITPIVEEMWDNIDTGGIGLERGVRKQEEILIANNPSIEDITKFLRLKKK